MLNPKRFLFGYAVSFNAGKLKVEKDGETTWEAGGSWIWKNKDMGII